MRTLARHGDYEITLHESGAQPGDKLVVTFGGQPSDLAQSGFGTSFALSLGYDTIHVAQRFGTQYQGLPLEAFLEFIVDAYIQTTGFLCHYYVLTLGVRLR